MAMQSIILRLLPLLFVAAAAEREPDGRPIVNQLPLMCDDYYKAERKNMLPAAHKPFIMLQHFGKEAGGTGTLYFLYQEFQVRISGSKLTHHVEFYRLNAESQATDAEEDAILIHFYPQWLGIDPEPVAGSKPYLVDRNNMATWLNEFMGIYYRYGKKSNESNESKEYHHLMSLIARNKPDIQPVVTQEWWRLNNFTELYDRDFNITLTRDQLKSMVDNRDIDFIYVHDDQLKTIVLEYSGPYLSFKFREDVLRRHIGYEVKQALYYEELPTPYEPHDSDGPDSESDTNQGNAELMKIWSAMVIELDKHYTFHFNRYVFKDAGRVLQIVSHDHYQMYGNDFFGCYQDRDNTVIVNPIQVKGIVSLFDPNKVGDALEFSRKTMIFLDLYYLLVDIDLMEVEFNLNTPSLPKKAYEINLRHPESVLTYERLSTKYVKHFYYDLVYFCFDSMREKPITYKPKKPLLEQPDSIDFEVNKPNVAGYCPGSILLIKRRLSNYQTPSKDCICFLRRHYFILSTDEMWNRPEDERVLLHRDSIGNIFKTTELDDIKDENFELVFRYLKDHVVFMTTRWLILLDINDFIFMYVRGYSRPNVVWERKLDPKAKSPYKWNNYYYFYIRMRNCLWRSCHQGRDLKERAAFSHELRRRIAMNETYDPYHPSKRKNDTPRKGDFTKSVPVHQPLAADHDPTARFGSSRSDSHGSRWSGGRNHDPNSPHPPGTKFQEQDGRYDEHVRHKQGL